MEKIWTDEQKAVIEHTGNSFVLAGSGAGKTSVIVEKINRIKKEEPGARILYITFTRRAKKEALSRIPNLDNVSIFNYHGLAYNILIANKQGLKLNEIDIVGTGYSINILKELFPSKEDTDGYNSKNYHKDLLSKINILKCNDTPIQEMSEKEKAIYIPYQEVLDSQGKMTYGCMIPLCLRLFERGQINPRTLMSLNYEYLFIDESQDTNRSQLKFVDCIKGVGKDTKLTIVGDLFQSLFSFQGARPDLILPAIQKYSCDVLPLFSNFRSQENVTDLGNNILQTINEFSELRPTLRATIPRGSKVNLSHYYNSNEEYAEITLLIKALVERKGYKYSDIYVLFRKNMSGFMLEKYLLQAKIPYELLQGSFLERKAVKVLIDLIKLGNLLSTEGYKDEEVYAYLHGIAPEIQDNIAGKTFKLLYESLPEVPFLEKMERIESLKIKGIGGERKKNFVEFSKIVLSIIDPFVAYKAGKLLKEDLIKNYSRIVLDFKFAKKSVQYMESCEEEMQHFSEMVNNLKDADIMESLNQILIDYSSEEDDEEDKNRVSLMSVHKAKGTEAKNIIVVDFQDFPVRDDNAEERRIVYVAVTRAKENLFLTMVGNKTLYYEVFLKSIKQGIMESDFTESEWADAIEFFRKKRENPEYFQNQNKTQWQRPQAKRDYNYS